MNLWLSCHLLFAGLVLGSSAPTPEECKALVTPLSVANASMQYGRVNFLVGYSDHEFNKEMLKRTNSSWVNTTVSASGEVIMSQGNKLNGICFSSKVNVTFEGNTGQIKMNNASSVFHFLPSCDGCMVLMINSTAKNIKSLLQLLKIDLDVEDVITARSLYLLGRQSTLTEPELKHFKQQASCLGFSGDPDFTYNTEKSFCAEGDGIKIPV